MLAIKLLLQIQITTVGQFTVRRRLTMRAALLATARHALFRARSIKTTCKATMNSIAY